MKHTLNTFLAQLHITDKTATHHCTVDVVGIDIAGFGIELLELKVKDFSWQYVVTFKHFFFYCHMRP